MAWQFHGKKNGRFYYDRPFTYWNSAATARLRKTMGFEVIAVRDEAAMTRALTYFKEEARVDYILIDTAGKIIVRQKQWKK